LPKEHRLRRKSDFNDAFCQRLAKANALSLSLRIAKNNLAVTRFGFVVSNKTAKNAADRNLIKRRMREAVQKFLQNIQPGYDIVIIAQPEISGKKFAEISETIKKLLSKTGLYISHSKFGLEYDFKQDKTKKGKCFSRPIWIAF